MFRFIGGSCEEGEDECSVGAEGELSVDGFEEGIEIG